MDIINSNEAVKIYGKTLLNQKIMTYPDHNQYPGGEAIIKSIHPKGRKYGENVCHILVHHIDGVTYGKRKYHRIGILASENIGINLPQNKPEIINVLDL